MALKLKKFKAFQSLHLHGGKIRYKKKLCILLAMDGIFFSIFKCGIHLFLIVSDFSIPKSIRKRCDFGESYRRQYFPKRCLCILITL
jgi:hypothetical protein